jgi:hypothetical protein
VDAFLGAQEARSGRNLLQLAPDYDPNPRTIEQFQFEMAAIDRDSSGLEDQAGRLISEISGK